MIYSVKLQCFDIISTFYLMMSPKKDLLITVAIFIHDDDPVFIN